MAKRKIDLTGKEFHYLTVIKLDDKPYRSRNGIPFAKWICKCKCGSIISVRQSHLVSGATKSCGCYQKESAKNRYRKTNAYVPHGDYTEVYDASGHMFIIDTEDISKVNGHYWCLSSKGYIQSSRSGERIHRIIMDCPKNMVVDHISGDRSDNRKCNLRICTQQENCFNKKHMSLNKTGRIGVHKNKRGKYVAQITKDGIMHQIGTFESVESASAARKKAEREYFGEFAAQEVSEDD